MALVSFKDLSIDADDPVALGTFWASALGLRYEVLDDGDITLTGPDKSQRVWINAVPEPKTVKQRVHLDVNGRSFEEYEAMGARVLPDWGQFAWTVMADPEGGEFCVFDVNPVPAYRLKDIVVDAADPAAAAQWWGEVMGARLVHDGDYSYLAEIPGAPFEGMDFVPVPGSKTVKNRIHWDVTLRDGATVVDLVARGATVLRAEDGEIEWTVMADPEGNEFCVFAP